ncbi:hypothetical protein NL676_002998 [Syzygium grande]|nr:hypothetical protein NL676_002998 [Syzygium grande]
MVGLVRSFKEWLSEYGKRKCKSFLQRARAAMKKKKRSGGGGGSVCKPRLHAASDFLATATSLHSGKLVAAAEGNGKLEDDMAMWPSSQL